MNLHLIISLRNFVYRLNQCMKRTQTLLTDETVYSLSEQIRESILLLENKWSDKQVDFDIDTFMQFEYFFHKRQAKPVAFHMM